MPAAKPRARAPADPFEALRSDIAQLHDCVHSVGKRVDSVAGQVGEVERNVGELTKEVYYIKGRQDAVATRVGVPEDNAVKRTVFFTERWKAIAAVAGGGTALVGLATAVAAILR